jgi:D-amino-acid dehydrogenase
MNRVAIIGAGINGLFSAWYLHELGYEVTVLDPGGEPDNCSSGNAGMIVPSHIVPLAAPGMIAQGLRWMLSPTSPFYLRLRPSAGLARWAWLFYKSSTAAHVERAIPVLRDISWLSRELYREFHQNGYFDFGWQENGLLMLYRTAGAEHEEIESAATARRAGIEAHVLDRPAVQALHAQTAVDVRGAIYYPGDAQVNPSLLVTGLRHLLAARGVRFLATAVLDFDVQRERIEAVVTAEERLPCDEAVLAAGAWTGRLARRLGLALPLEGGKGYSFAIPGRGDRVPIPSILLEARATVTGMDADLRCAGTLEIAGLDRSVDLNRVRGIVEGVNRFFPDLNLAMPARGAVWSGLRPCSPDGLPYIGRVPGLKNATVATGHGMMGLSLGPATGKLIAEIIAGRSPSLPVAAFSPARWR